MASKGGGRIASFPARACALGLLAGVLFALGCRLPEPAGAPEATPVLTQQQHARYATAEGRLHSPDPAVRRQAAIALLSMDYPPAFKAVLEALQDAREAGVRISMIRAAAFCVERRCFEAILASINDPDPNVQREAALALARFTHPEEIDSVVAFISRPDTTPPQRSMLFRTLGEALAVRAVPVLLNGLEAPDEETRLAAYEALLNISRRDLPPNVTQWQEWWGANAHRTREDVLSEHRQALAHEGVLYREQISVLTDEKRELTRLIGAARAETPQTLLAALSSRYDSVRLYASVRLAALDAQQVAGLKPDERDYNVLRDSLDDESSEVRCNVVRFGAELSGPYREDLLRKALADEDPGVLTIAIAGTRSTTGPQAIKRLAELLTRSRHPAVRTEAAIALGKVGSEESVPALLAALDDTEENVRWFAVEGLRKLGAVHAVPRVSELLREDESARVRQIAAGALGELGQPAGAVALSEALGDRNVKVRETAASALLDLAVDDADRMTVIAEKFRAYGMPDRAKEVLHRLIQQFGEVQETRAQVMKAYKALADMEEEQGNPAAAAAAYEKLHALSEGALDSRQGLVRCWIRAGEAARAAGAVKDWLGAPDAPDRSALAELALDAAELMIESGQRTDASAVLDAVAGAAALAGDRRVELRIERLRRRVGP